MEGEGEGQREGEEESEVGGGGVGGQRLIIQQHGLSHDVPPSLWGTVRARPVTRDGLAGGPEVRNTACFSTPLVHTAIAIDFVRPDGRAVRLMAGNCPKVTPGV